MSQETFLAAKSFDTCPGEKGEANRGAGDRQWDCRNHGEKQRLGHGRAPTVP